MSFHTYDEARAMVRAIGRIVGAIEERDKDLARQLRRAATSVPANISEGNRRHGGDRLYHWRVAAGSADECRALLHSAEDWGHLEAAQTAPALAHIDSVCALLWRLTHR